MAPSANDAPQISAWAQALVESVGARQPFSAPWDDLSLSDGYRVQDEVRRLLEPERGPLAGYKVAITAKPLQDLLGIDHPLGGQVHAGQLRPSGVRLAASAFVGLALECEVTIRVGRDLPPASVPYTRESIVPFVGELIVSFEVLDAREAAIAAMGASGLVADRCACEGAVLGTATSDFAGLDLAGLGGFACELEWNGEVVDRGVTGNAMGHPFEGLAWVANHVIARGGQLRAGDVVLTGSAFAPRPASAGDRATYRIDGLGEVSVTVTA